MNRLDTSKGAISLYLQIAEILKEKIIKEEYAYGEYIPSEKELEKLYGVSRITARQAIQELEKDHLVERARGKGTMVIYRPHINENLDAIRSFTDEMIEQGLRPGSKDEKVSVVEAEEWIASIFHIHMGAPLYYVERVRTGNEKEIVYFESYYTMDAELPLDPAMYHNGVYCLLKQKGILPHMVEEQFDCLMPMEKIREKLNTQPDMPVLRRRRIAYDKKGKVIEYVTGYYRSDCYSYQIRMGG